MDYGYFINSITNQLIVKKLICKRSLSPIIKRAGACLLLAVVVFVSCNDSDNDEEDIKSPVFSGYAKNLKAYSGNNRAKLTFEIGDDPVNYFVVSWNNGSSSDTISKDKAKSGVIETIIDGLSEGAHTFEILAYDEKENPAVASVLIQVKVYGGQYLASLQNREIKDLTFIYGKDPIIDWYSARDGEVALDLNYTDEAGEPRDLRITNDQNATVLPAYHQNTSLEYRSLYLPVKTCIDTFYSTSVTIPPPTYYASVATKKIIEKSGLVSQVVSQSASDIYEDVEYSTLRFQDQENKPLSIFILRADLTDDKITLSTLMPNNGTDFGLQIVKAMAECRDNAGEQVIAAVNGDFFEWSPVAGRPIGPVFVNGTMIQGYDGDGRSYFAIRNDGKPQVGVFSEVPETGYRDLRDVIGGRERLVAVGANTSLGGTREPRTMVGYTDDDVVYLVVVDGRNSAYSAGMTLTGLSDVMQSLGVLEAINLDGGGSSTMVLKEDGAFNVVNTCSDGSPRAVANSLAIVAK